MSRTGPGSRRHSELSGLHCWDSSPERATTQSRCGRARPTTRRTGMPPVSERHRPGKSWWIELWSRSEPSSSDGYAHVFERDRSDVSVVHAEHVVLERQQALLGCLPSSAYAKSRCVDHSSDDMGRTPAELAVGPSRDSPDLELKKPVVMLARQLAHGPVGAQQAQSNQSVALELVPARRFDQLRSQCRAGGCDVPLLGDATVRVARLPPRAPARSNEISQARCDH